MHIRFTPYGAKDALGTSTDSMKIGGYSHILQKISKSITLIGMGFLGLENNKSLFVLERIILI